MSATNNIFKLLSDLSGSADKIIENTSELKPRLSEWISIIKNKADRIVESETTTESEEIPDLMSFLKGTRNDRGPRVSTVLTEIQKMHLHRQRGKSSTKARKSRHSSIKTPKYRKSVKGFNSDTPKLRIPPTVIKQTGAIFDKNVDTSTSSMEKKVETFTPMNERGTILKTGNKRKSSSELPLKKENAKKPKINFDQQNDPQDRDKSMHYPRIEKPQMKAINSSLLPNYANIKSSVGATKNVSVLLENRTLRSKIETKQDKAVENRKNIMALRQQKMEQNKKTREEKMEKRVQQRLQLEKQKLNKLRSGGREKTVATPKGVMQKIIAENETLGEASKKDAVGKSKDKQTSVKKLQMNLKKMGNEWVLKSCEKTPVKKNQKQTERMLNTTYVSGEEQLSTSSKQVKTLKKANIDSNSGAPMKDISASKAKTLTKSTKTMKSQLIDSTYTSTPAQKKGPESYAITPARSSFVSYDISEIRSDSEEEEQETNSKPIPSWATGVRLRNALLQQHHHPIDTDELFGNIVDLPDLALIMGVKKKHYNKRTSSAVWNSTFS